MRFRPLSPALLLLALATLWVTAGDDAPAAAPEFSAETLDGQTVALSDYRGRVVLLDFWASWCGPCLQEMPFLVELQNAHADSEMIVLAVNIDNKAANARRFLEKLPAQPAFPILLDPGKTIPPLYDLEAMPTTVLIDRGGNIRFRHNGFSDDHRERITTEVETLLNEATH